MRFGSIYGSGFGSPSAMLEQPTDVRSVRAGTAVQVRITPAAGFGDAWFGVYVNCNLAGLIYADEGATTARVSFPCPTGTKDVLILRHGNLREYDMARVARRHFAQSTAKKITMSWIWPAEILSVINADGAENSDLSSWSLSGLTYAGAEAGEIPTRRKFEVTVATSGGTTTVTLKRYSRIVASGTVTAPGTCALSEQNSSGISGSVVVGATPADASGAYLYIRYPQSLRVLRDTADPPTTIRDTINFTASDDTKWTEPAALAAGTYYYQAEYISDTGDEGTQTATHAVTIPGPPGAPTGLAYSSGDAAATVLSFTASTTPGATYRAYLQQADGAYVNMGAVAATASAGATTITLPAITGYAGTAYVILRAVYGGIEEQNSEVLALEYDAAGGYIPPRPNAPTIKTWSVTSGNALAVTVTYDPTDEPGVATQILMALRTPAGSYNWAAADDTQPLAQSTTDPTIKAASLSVIGVANGWHYVAARAATAAGTQGVISAEQLIYIDTTDLAAPTIEIDIARG